MVSRVSDRHTLDLGACQGGGAPGNPQVLSQDPGTSVPRSRATGRPWPGPHLSSPQTLRGACLELANVFTQSSAFRDTRKPNRVMTPPYRRRESGPAGDPNHRHTAPAPNCVTGRTSPDSWNPPSTGKKKKNHVLGTWPERTRRSVSCKITRDKTSSLKHKKKKSQEVRREN